MGLADILQKNPFLFALLSLYTRTDTPHRLTPNYAHTEGRAAARPQPPAGPPAMACAHERMLRPEKQAREMGEMSFGMGLSLSVASHYK